VKIIRNIPIMNHHSPEGHCEIVFRNVRVPVENIVSEEGSGFALAQARLGTGPYPSLHAHHRQCELALELMCERALSRKAFGKHLSDTPTFRTGLPSRRIEIDQARLLVLHAAWRMDREGNKAARVDVSAIKIIAPRLQTRVLDRAIQVFGAMGLTPDTPLAYFWTWAARAALHRRTG